MKNLLMLAVCGLLFACEPQRRGGGDDDDDDDDYSCLLPDCALPANCPEEARCPASMCACYPGEVCCD